MADHVANPDLAVFVIALVAFIVGGYVADRNRRPPR